MTSSADTRRAERRRMRRDAVVALGRRCAWHEMHALQVARLAGELFRRIPLDGIRSGPAEEWLEYAALLHDIGYAVNAEGHHRHAERIIRAADLPGFLPREVIIVALVARFHRKRAPEIGDPLLAGLGPVDERAIRGLTAILRVADGLDRTHRGLVRAVSVRVEAAVDIAVTAADAIDAELWAARKKRDLLEDVVGRPMIIRPA